MSVRPTVTITGADDDAVVFHDAMLIVVKTFDGDLHVFADERLSTLDLRDAMPELAAQIARHVDRPEW